MLGDNTLCKMQQNFNQSVQKLSAAKSATKHAQQLCCTFDTAIWF